VRGTEALSRTFEQSISLSSRKLENTMDLKALQTEMDGFVRGRGWYSEDTEKPQTPKNLAASLVLEAAELLECFQWTDHCERDAVASELADIILYAAQLANVMSIDLADAVAEKIRVNRSRPSSWKDRRTL
jgi:NTP pyrophosphatase (non-canonical NTP hydrolase)